MTHYGLNDCTNLSNIIDIMNSLTYLCADILYFFSVCSRLGHAEINLFASNDKFPNSEIGPTLLSQIGHAKTGPT